MVNVNLAFRRRIGFPEHEPITFAKLPDILYRTAQALPFENLSILSGRTKEISDQNLTQKIIQQKEGGLCYELNAILYLFLLQNGFKVVLICGVVYSEPEQDWSRTERTHAAILLFHQGKEYLLDTGFGGNLPLMPVPLTGETVFSDNGEFKVKQENSPYGNYIFEVKLKYKHEHWKTGYAFDTKHQITNVSDLNSMQETTKHHPASAFNKKPLVTRLTSQGSITLTGSSLTEWVKGIEIKKPITEDTFQEALKTYFNIETGAQN
ncbi:arylamine N-acetyltransferase family protein [Domibacillus robiginosus]|uniref:arylamine N-acetyltransferase family protein n=1 Tax=Domibacillus robiginosus TaxID=1071054 RepID=UPI00067AD2D6|nr:arylamine N-acetyltransferase [Domibacillus robiginosus]